MKVTIFDIFSFSIKKKMLDKKIFLASQENRASYRFHYKLNLEWESFANKNSGE